MIRVCVCRDAQKEAGLAEKKLQRLEASRDAEQAGLREQLDAALAGVQPRAMTLTPVQTPCMGETALFYRFQRHVELLSPSTAMRWPCFDTYFYGHSWNLAVPTLTPTLDANAVSMRAVPVCMTSMPG